MKKAVVPLLRVKPQLLIFTLYYFLYLVSFFVDHASFFILTYIESYIYSYILSTIFVPWISLKSSIECSSSTFPLVTPPPGIIMILSPA